ALSDWMQITNTAPMFTEISPQSLVIDEDTIGSIQLNATDADNDNIVWTLQSQPQSGAATIINGLVQYAPKANYNGTDALNIQISDNLGGHASLTITVSIQPVNDPPLISSYAHEGNENIVHWFTASDFFTHFTDIDDDSLHQIKITHLPDQGTIRLNETPIEAHTDISISDIADLNYLPALDWGGTTAYTWLAFDGTDWSVLPARVEMIIEPDPVDIGTITKTGMEDQYLEFDESDLRNFTLNTTSSIKAVSLPPHGSM
ncbi:MAG: hypothetical protein OMM_14794, partial [Candidatus Magnetoglobus multicellularis str. Araruama]